MSLLDLGINDSYQLTLRKKKGIMRLLTVTLSFVFISLTLSAQDSLKLHSIFQKLDSIEKIQRVEGSWLGLNVEELEDRNRKPQHPEKYHFQTIEEQKKISDTKRFYLKQLKNLNKNTLSTGQNINREIRIIQLENEFADFDYNMYMIPLNAEGGFYSAPTFFLNRLPFNTYEDYKGYLKWLPTYVDYMAYNQSLMKKGIEENIQAPKVIVNNTINLLDPWTDYDKLEKNPFYSSFNNMPASVSPDQAAELQLKAREILTKTIVPSYETFKSFLQEEYLKSANSFSS